MPICQFGCLGNQCSAYFYNSSCFVGAKVWAAGSVFQLSGDHHLRVAGQIASKGQGRTSEAIRKLMGLQAKTARVMRDNQEMDTD